MSLWITICSCVRFPAYPSQTALIAKPRSMGGTDSDNLLGDRCGFARRIGDFRKPWRRCCVELGLGMMVPVVNEEKPEVTRRPDRPKAQPKPKMKYNGLVFHGLRRTFITDAEHAGLPRHEAMKLSGHKTESVYRRYGIENRTQRRAAVAQLLEYRTSKVGDNSGTIPQTPSEEEAVIC